MRRAIRARIIVLGAVIAAATAVAAIPASAQVRTVTIQQISTGRFVDAGAPTVADRIVTEPAQNDATQQWIMTPTGGNTYSFQQVSSGLFWDAHDTADRDYEMVTRTAQSNTTQRWTVTELGGGVYTIQQVSTGRFVDAYAEPARVVAGSIRLENYRLVTRADNFLATDSRLWRIRIINEVVPAERGEPPIIIPPIGVPSILSSGTFDLLPSGRVNLDNGTPGAAGADLAYGGSVGNLQLLPVGGAQISFTDGTQRGIGTAGVQSCATAAYTTAPVPLALISTGDFICMRTGEGHFSEFRVNSIGLVLRRLSISYETWQ